MPPKPSHSRSGWYVSIQARSAATSAGAPNQAAQWPGHERAYERAQTTRNDRCVGKIHVAAKRQQMRSSLLAVLSVRLLGEIQADVGAARQGLDGGVRSQARPAESRVAEHGRDVQDVRLFRTLFEVQTHAAEKVLSTEPA
jgi:hypothetical protein